MRRMATIAAVLLAVALCAFSLELARPKSVVANAGMPDPALTGAPSQGTCFSCHNGGLNDLNGGVLIFGVPPQYTPGAQYDIGVLITRLSGSTRWGFELTALTGSNQMAGSLNDNTAVVGKQSQGGIDYVSQTTLKGSDGTYADSLGGVWTFSWTAPSAGAGPVTFYAAGVACDQDNAANAGDFSYTTFSSSIEGSATDVKATTWGQMKQLFR